MLGKMFRKTEKADEKSGVRYQRNKSLVASMELNEQQVFDSEKITLGSLIGSGGFAKVYHCKLEGHERAVCKAINAEKIDQEAAYLLTNECTIWAKLEHPHIVSFYGMSWTSTTILLLCEFMPGGSLQEANEKQRKSGRVMQGEVELIGQLTQVASGMAYLHSFEPPVLHRDLKSANILLAADSDRLAIADFGLARYQENQKKMTAETGSYRWMSPEVIRHEKYDWRCDVYSFAVLAWECLTYRIPFEKLMPVEAAFAVAKEAKRPALPEGCPVAVSHMLNQCWHQEACKRPSFRRICSALAEEAALLEPAGGHPVPTNAPAISE